jgi:hypothetical protein
MEVTMEKETHDRAVSVFLDEGIRRLEGYPSSGGLRQVEFDERGN